MLNRRMLICIFTGLPSGLLLYLLLNLVPAWLKTEGLSLRAIGAFALIQFTPGNFSGRRYSTATVSCPWLGRRRKADVCLPTRAAGSDCLAGALVAADDLPLIVVLTAVLAFFPRRRRISRSMPFAGRFCRMPNWGWAMPFTSTPTALPGWCRVRWR